MTTDDIMLALAIVIIAALVARGIAQRLALGPIVALLAVGAALGPHSPYPLLAGHIEEMRAVGEIGVVLLLFLIGLDTRPELLRSMRGLVFGSAIAQYLLATAALAAVLVLLGFEPWKAALVVALGLGMSSDAIAVAAIDERGERATPPGRAVTAALIAQGFIAIPVLAVIPLLAGPDAASDSGGGLSTPLRVLGLLAALGAVYVGGRYLLPAALGWCARRLGPSGFGLAILAAVFLAAWVMDAVGASMALGSFLLGMILSGSHFAEQIRASIGSRKTLLLGILFIAIGMSIDPHELAKVGWELVAVLPLLLGIKVASVLLLARRFGLDLRQALLAGLLLAPFDEIGFVVFASAQHHGLLHPEGYALGLTLISFSFVVSPPLINLAYALSRRWRRHGPTPQWSKYDGELDGHVAVVGYSYTGRVICSLLARAGVPYIAFDLDLERIAEGQTLGHNVHYGDVTDPDMLGAASIAGARDVVVTTRDYGETRSVVGNLRAFYPQVPVLAAVPYLFQRDELRRLGVPEAMALMPEGMLELGRQVLARAGVGPTEIAQHTADLRADDYALLRGVRGSVPRADVEG